MGKGGPMAFLNKKTWHPGRVQNMEEVWKREQAASKEDQKMKDLQKQIAEERAREEMMQVAEAAGVKVRSDRLDWMYQGGVAARQEADQRQAATAAGAPTETNLGGSSKKAHDEEDQGLGGRAGAVAALPSFYSEDTPASANEMWQRLHADPLFAIKQQEVTARRTILSNPVQMQAIKAQVKQLKGGRGDVSSEEEEEGGRKRRHRRDGDRKKEKKRKKERKDRSRSRSPKREKTSRRRERDGKGEEERGRDEREDSEHRRRKRKSRSRTRSRSRSPRRDRGRDRDDSSRRDRDGRDYRRRSRSRSPEEYRRRQQRESSRRDEERDGGGGGRGERREREEERKYSRDDDRYDGDRKDRKERREREDPVVEKHTEKEKESQKRPQVHMDGASAQGAGAQYGITYGKHVPDAVKNQDRSHLGEATRKRLEEAARRKQEERDAVAERNRRRRDSQHRPGRLTEEERQRRLQEMTAAADEHDAHRHARIEEYEKVEAKEESERQQRGNTETAAFLQAATKDVYGAGGGGNGGGSGSLADAVGRRKAFQQRGDGGGSAFRK